MGPAQHFLTYPLQGWRIEREDTTVKLIDPKGNVSKEETFKDEPTARKAVWLWRTEAYASEGAEA